MKERTIVEDWDGPVVGGGDRFFEDLDSAVEWYWDDCFNGDAMDITQVPEFVECCDEKGPYLCAENVVESLDNYDCNVHSDDNYASNAVEPTQIVELQKFLDSWCDQVPWRCWQSNGKYIALRPLVEEYERVCQHRNLMCDAMDGFKATSDEY